MLVAYWDDPKAQPKTADNAATLDLVDLPLDERGWSSVGGIDVDAGRSPRWKLIGADRLGAGAPRPDGRGWTTWHQVPDTGVLDIFDYRTNGNVTRLTFNPHDDADPTWAPDQSRFAFVTTRWHTVGQSHIAIDSVSSGLVRQVTAGNDRDGSPLWSPDGARIAFVRENWLGGHAVCVVDVDGERVRCMPAEKGSVTRLGGWLDAHRVVFDVLDGSNYSIAIANVDTHQQEILEKAGAYARASPDGRWIVCRCTRPGYHHDSWMVYPSDRPNELRVLRMVGGITDDAVGFTWGPGSPRSRYVSTLRITTGAGTPTLGMSHQLRVAGFDTAGRPVDLSPVRWRSLDTAVATIDSSGLLVPRRVGRLTVEASAGGWRTTRTDLEIRAARNDLLVDERWNEGLEPAWSTYGVPRPKIVHDSRFGNAFNNNGDDSFFSGAYTMRSFEVRNGLWVEAEMSVPVTEKPWQDQDLVLADIDSTRWAEWDRRTGDRPGGGNGQCRLYVPQGDGVHRGDSLYVEAPKSGGQLPAPASLRTGKPFLALVQIFPDGRCGFAIDGQPLWISPPNFAATAVHVLLSGRSVGTEILVGHLRVFSGIAPRVDWRALERNAPARRSIQ